jgi:hypothetical protein
MKIACELPSLNPPLWGLFAVFIFIIAVYRYKLDFFYSIKNLSIGCLIMFLVGFVSNI